MASATPRQYKPTYTYIPPIVNTPGPQLPSSITQPAPAYSRRRRTTSNFPRIDPLHSRPTVASSNLTASTSCNDIINPIVRVPRQSLPAQSDEPGRIPRRTTPFPFDTCDNSRRTSNGLHGVAYGENARAKTPSRIPTPISRAKLLSQQRVVTSPAVLVTCKEPPIHRFLASYENVAPVGNRTLTKSRTMNALSTVRSALTRSTHDLKAFTSPKSADSTPTKSKHDLKSSPRATTSKTSPPLPEFITNVRQISKAMPSAYWAGRFTALYDRFRSEILARNDLLESPFFRKLLLEPRLMVPQGYEPPLHDDGNPRFPKTNMIFDYEATEHVKQAKRAFVHLEALCLTKEAEKSLYSFRISYARMEGNNELLPPGVKLHDAAESRNSLIAKAGRIFSGSGRKSGFGMNGRKSGSRMRTSTGRIGG